MRVLVALVLLAVAVAVADAALKATEKNRLKPRPPGRKGVFKPYEARAKGAKQECRPKTMECKNEKCPGGKFPCTGGKCTVPQVPCTPGKCVLPQEFIHRCPLKAGPAKCPLGSSPCKEQGGKCMREFIDVCVPADPKAVAASKKAVGAAGAGAADKPGKPTDKPGKPADKPSVASTVEGILKPNGDGKPKRRRRAMLLEERSTVGPEWCNRIPAGDLQIWDDAIKRTKVIQTVAHDVVLKWCQTLKAMPKDRVYYHYGTWRDMTRWAVQGAIDKGEVDFLATHHDGQAAGGGVYMAGDSDSSRSYGQVAVMILIRAGVPIWDTSNLKLLGLTMSVTDAIKAQIGQFVPFIHNSNTNVDWWVTHCLLLCQEIGFGPDLVKTKSVKVSLAENFQAGRSAPNWNTPMSFMEYWKLVNPATQAGGFKWDSIVDGLNSAPPGAKYAAALRDSIGYLTSLYYLLYYFDGISFMRAIKVAPDDPWSQFEPEKFGNYKDVIDRYTRKAAEGTPIAFVKGTTFGDGSGKDAWARKILSSTLMNLYKDFCGHPMSIRTGEVRAGGDEKPDRDFECTPGQAMAMQANPYLNTFVNQVDSKYTCHYKYPSAADSKKLLGMTVQMTDTKFGLGTWKPDWLSNPCPNPAKCSEIADLVNSKDAAAWAADPSAGATTQKIINQLILNVFAVAYGKTVDSTTVTDLMVGLVGIHPADDCNGRSTRGVGIISAIEAGKDPPASFIGDLDLVTPRSLYRAFLDAATAQYANVRFAWLRKMLYVVFNENRKVAMSDLADLPETKGLFTSLNVFMPKDKQLTADTAMTKFTAMLPDIEKRRWITVLNNFAGGPTWINYNNPGNPSPPALELH